MEIEVVRSALKNEYTIGHMYINSKFFCDTIEDVVRELWSERDKIYGETAIPYGEYKVVMSYSPKYAERGKKDPYYAKFNGMMPEIKDVPFFSGIRIHPGSTEKDSLGCIIVGENKQVGRVINSRNTFDKLWKLINDASKKRESITIKIVKR